MTGVFRRAYNPTMMLRRSRRWVGTVGSAQTRALATSVAGTSTVGFTFTVLRGFSVNVAGVGTVTPNLKTTRKLATLVTGTSTVSFALRGIRGLATAIAGTSLVSFVMREVKSLRVLIAGVGNVVPNFSTIVFVFTITEALKRRRRMMRDGRWWGNPDGSRDEWRR